MVDKDGRKMSKSLGNTLEVEELLEAFGADVCRWWVASLNTENDIKADMAFFRGAGESYRKVRNTIRFMLSNLSDFDGASQPAKAMFSEADALSIDAWAMQALASLVTTVRDAYERFAFPVAHKALFDFCNDTMSAVYLAAVKDRLYCDRVDSPRRRRTQATLHAIADALVRLLAPFLPHTADEAWAALHGEEAASVHLGVLPEAEAYAVAVDADWSEVMSRRDAWLRRIETVRQRDGIDNPLDLGVRVADAQGVLSKFDAVDLADLLGVSVFSTEGRGGETEIEVLDLRAQPRCERSWKRDGTVKQRSDGGMLSDRDAEAVGV